MLGNNPAFHLGTIAKTYASIGAMAPAALTEAVDRIGRFRTAQLAPADGQIVAAIARALDRGVSPGTDPDVQRLTAEMAIGNEGIARSLVTLAEADAREVVRGLADQVVTDWRAVFDPAAERLAEAFEVLGPIELTDTQAVVQAGAAAAEAWASATASVAAIDTITRGWHALHQLLRGEPHRNGRILWHTDAEFDTFEAARTRDLHADPWPLTVAGHALSLPTLNEYRARLAAIENERARRAQLGEAAAKNSMKGVPLNQRIGATA